MYECRCIFYDLLYGTLNISCRGWDFESKMEFRSKVSNMAFFVIVAAGILTSISMSSVSSVTSVFADKCDNNGDNNSTTILGVIWARYSQRFDKTESTVIVVTSTSKLLYEKVICSIRVSGNYE